MSRWRTPHNTYSTPETGAADPKSSVCDQQRNVLTSSAAPRGAGSACAARRGRGGWIAALGRDESCLVLGGPLEPGDGPLQTLIQGDRRHIGEQLAQAAGIGLRVPNVTGSGRNVPDIDGNPDDVGHPVGQIHDWYPRTESQVHRFRAGHLAEYRFSQHVYHSPDKGEVPGLLTISADEQWI